MCQSLRRFIRNVSMSKASKYNNSIPQKHTLMTISPLWHRLEWTLTTLMNAFDVKVIDVSCWGTRHHVYSTCKDKSLLFVDRDNWEMLDLALPRTALIKLDLVPVSFHHVEFHYVWLGSEEVYEIFDFAFLLGINRLGYLLLPECFLCTIYLTHLSERFWLHEFGVLILWICSSFLLLFSLDHDFSALIATTPQNCCNLSPARPRPFIFTGGHHLSVNPTCWSYWDVFAVQEALSVRRWQWTLVLIPSISRFP